MERINDLRSAQFVDDRPTFAPLRSDEEWPPRRVDTGGMHPAECCTNIGSEPEKIVRWNEAPDYPHPPEPGTPNALDTALILAAYVMDSVARNPIAWLASGVSALLSIFAVLHVAGRMGWLS